ncbi:MAG: electron transfer flavoprotein subunit alpha/FixB family protein [Bacteroidales bacterium]|nr:electron transfer flavoprotein subunit alpha/FixB family protein [Candidatus Scybalousia scybalohippi]MCQ2326321.1 electron transfer flavoprotein subunit alpha/FixB family protein [Bacteroidales bacterium]
MNKEDYKNIFVFVEQRENKIQNVALELLGKARELADVLGQEVYAMFLGNGIKNQAQELIAYGADKVLLCEDKNLEVYTTEPYTQAINQIINDYKPSIVFIGATTIGRDLGPRVAARVNTGLVADCTKLEINEEDHELWSTRPAFGGNLMATIVNPDHRPQMSTVRPGVMRKMPKDDSRKGEVVDVKINFDESKIKVKVLETVKKEAKVDITQAKILVSGGRGVANKEGFEKLAALADVLKGEVASSRAMVDAGIIEHDRQVGQTGKTVRPNMYMACGISGAIQHMAGMEDSEFIVAINKDKYAPIMQIADLGIVGDLHKIVPMLTERLKQEIKK